MNSVHYSPERLIELFRHQRIATLPELKKALGSPVDVTVFRKLSTLAGAVDGAAGAGRGVAGRLALFYGLLDEQQRRLYAGLESLQHGHGGDRRMAELLGLDVTTVARGRRDLVEGKVLRERIRREGGGRKPGPYRDRGPSAAESCARKKKPPMPVTRSMPFPAKPAFRGQGGITARARCAGWALDSSSCHRGGLDTDAQSEHF
jgi:hypothetical protein